MFSEDGFPEIPNFFIEGLIGFYLEKIKIKDAYESHSVHSIPGIAGNRELKKFMSEKNT